MNIITEFEYLERMLGEVLDVVPYEAKDPSGKMQPENVWSPRLATILQEACSQLDSYLAHQLTNQGLSGNFGIREYKNHFGSWLAPRKLVFWQDENGNPVGLQPWKGADVGTSPDWWEAYQNVKHDRMENKKRATLKNTVEALAGLFLVIIRVAGLDVRLERMFVASKWWRGAGQTADIGEPTDAAMWQSLNYHNVIETGLLSFPLGWWNDKFALEYFVDFDQRVVQFWSRLDAHAAQLTKQDNCWGGMAGRNNPALVGGSERWQFFFNQWVYSQQRPVTATSPFEPLIRVFP